MILSSKSAKSFLLFLLCATLPLHATEYSFSPFKKLLSIIQLKCEDYFSSNPVPMFVAASSVFASLLAGFGFSFLWNKLCGGSKKNKAKIKKLKREKWLLKQQKNKLSYEKEEVADKAKRQLMKRFGELETEKKKLQQKNIKLSEEVEKIKNQRELNQRYKLEAGKKEEGIIKKEAENGQKNRAITKVGNRELTRNHIMVIEDLVYFDPFCNKMVMHNKTDKNLELSVHVDDDKDVFVERMNKGNVVSTWDEHGCIKSWHRLKKEGKYSTLAPILLLSCAQNTKNDMKNIDNVITQSLYSFTDKFAHKRSVRRILFNFSSESGKDIGLVLVDKVLKPELQILNKIGAAKTEEMARQEKFETGVASVWFIGDGGFAWQAGKCVANNLKMKDRMFGVFPSLPIKMINNDKQECDEFKQRYCFHDSSAVNEISKKIPGVWNIYLHTTVNENGKINFMNTTSESARVLAYTNLFNLIKYTSMNYITHLSLHAILPIQKNKDNSYSNSNRSPEFYIHKPENTYPNLLRLEYAKFLGRDEYARFDSTIAGKMLLAEQDSSKRKEGLSEIRINLEEKYTQLEFPKQLTWK